MLTLKGQSKFLLNQTALWTSTKFGTALRNFAMNSI
jgi:hypothetical protein